MSIIEILQQELELEAQITRKMLTRVPDEKYDWKPHEKSMTMQQLATHIAELPSWVAMAIATDGLDFAVNPYNPEKITNTQDLLAFFEKSLKEGQAQLAKATEDTLSQIWTLRNGDQILLAQPKREVIRYSLSQIIHHRAQLGVYFRLLDIPVPATYGPSADDESF